MTTPVLFVTKVSGVKGGTEKHLIDLIARIDPSRVSSTILCYGIDPFTEIYDHGSHPGVDVVQERAPAGLWSFRRSFARRKPATIVFVNGDLTMLPLSAYAAARLSGAKRLVTILHKDPRTGPEPGVPAPVLLLKKLKRFVVRRLPGLLSHKTICVSSAIRATLISDYHYPAARTVAVPNGVDLEHYRRGRHADGKRIRDELGLADADPVLVCIARLVHSKGIDVLLKAFAVVHRQHPAAACVIIGDGPLEMELRAMAETLGVAGSVMFLGRKDDVIPYLEASDVFVLSSSWEGLPLVLLEAMACGLPCVASDLGGNKEVVAHGETGLIVKTNSVDELAEAVLYLAKDDKERKRMGVAGRRRVEELFDIDRAMARIASIIVDRG